LKNTVKIHEKNIVSRAKKLTMGKIIKNTGKIIQPDLCF